MPNQHDDDITITRPGRPGRGLGRGLSSLFRDDEEAPDGYGGAVPAGAQRRIIGVEQLVPNVSQPRRDFDEDGLRELARSIEKHGVLQPILVRPKAGHTGLFEIVAGERRWRAAQIARVHEVPAVIHELDDRATLEIALIENLQREDLSALDEALGYQRLIEDFDRTHDELAEALGKSRSHIANMIRLLKLPPEVQDMLRRGEISSGHARAIINTPDPAALARQITEQGLNVRQAEALVRKAAAPGTAADPRRSSSPAAKDVDTRALEEEVGQRLGMKVDIRMKGRDSGQLRVDFGSLDQLDLILHRLSQK